MSDSTAAERDPKRVLRMALTFGSDYAYGAHPRLGVLADPGGYIIVEAPADAYYEFVELVVGHTDGQKSGTLAYAFDYPAEEFEATQVERYGYHKLAEFSALPKVGV